MAHPGDERALPADTMVDGDLAAADGSTGYPDDDVDVISLMQERDAYRLETEKLRKIIERQRFIIKSLQDQISRKQSGSSANTPTFRNSELSPENMERLPLAVGLASAVADTASPASAASATSSIDGRLSTTSAATNTHTAFPNALGLSSLTAGSPQTSAQTQRNISQGSFNANLLPVDNRGSGEMAVSSANQRPWAKSTRLSEIYADYSARHNSVTPMFKSNAYPDAKQMQPVAPINASSFVDSLKTSISRSEWPGEWNNHAEHDYSTDRLNDRRISSLVLDSSREPSMSLDIEDRADILLDSQPERTFMAKPGNASSTVASRDTRSIVDKSRDGNFSIYANASLESPPAAPVDHQGGSPGQAASELLVLHPMSLLVDRNNSGRLKNGLDGGDTRQLFGDDENNENDDGYGWKEAALSGYEYGRSAVDRLHGQDDHSLQNNSNSREESQRINQPAQSSPPRQPQQQQLRAPRMDEQQRQHMPYQQQTHHHLSSPSYGPNADSLASVSMEPMMSTVSSTPASTNTMFLRSDSAAFGNGSLSTPEPTARDLRGVPSSNTDNNGHHQFAATDRDSNAHYESSAVPVPLGVTPTRGITAEPYMHPLQPPLTSLRNIDIQIKDSRVKIDERGKEVNVYMIDIVHRREISGLSLQEILIESQQSQVVLWTVEKRYSDFLNLNSQLQHVVYIERLVDKLERLPEKEIFRANAPTKNDKRKHWFEKYLKKALSMSFKDKRPLLEFFSTDCTMEPEKKMPILLGHKEGFLVKKGKNFGGWKRRYYVCKSNQPVLEYFEMPGSAVMGTINLSGAVVKTGKTPKETPSARARPGHKDADIFRHAFLIEERPRREGKEPIAHPLWADSDRERDEWVTALRYVIVRDAEGPERAMEEVARYANYAKSKESNLLMIQQIQTSITHEHGARRSIEYNRRREEQRHAAVASAGLSTIDEADARQTALQKIGSPLSKQMWPVTASLGNLTHHGASSADSPVDSPESMPLAVNGSSHAQKYNSRGRPRSLSLPPIQDGEGGGASAVPRADNGTTSTRLSPAVIAATLSTSFTGHNDSLANQAECMSVHYVPSEISTIESSIYSSYNGHDGNQRLNDISSRSIGDGNSYASEPDSPVSPRGGIDKNAAQLAGRKPVANHPFDSTSSVGGPPPAYESNAGSFPDMAYYNRYLGEQTSHGMQPVDGKPRAQFTKDSVGRIVREEEHAPDLPKFTPHVTDDILGVGRLDPSLGDSREAGNQGALSSIFNGGRTRTREEKKRGRITFMWGKRKPADNESTLPDVASPGGSSSSSTGPYGGGLDTPPVPAPRRLRRGSTNNDARNHSSKQAAFRGPVFGLPLEAVVEQTKIREHYHLPAVVYRCIEFLDTKKACLEEGIYRQSGSSLALNILRKEFNTNRDYNLLKLSRPPDIHAVASLLKAYLRELPESVLTTRLRQEFVRVVDLAERRDRVHELGRLVSELPLANYTLLRALTAHLIRIVQKASTNLMTLRNIGIVFSPSLGIPVGVFSLLMVEFEYIFWVNDSGAPEPRSLSVGSDGGAAEVLNAHGGPSNAPQKIGHMLDAPLSISVPTDIDRMAGDDNIYSAGSNAGTDCYSLASDVAAHPHRAPENRPPGSILRHVGSRQEIEGQRNQDKLQSAAPVASAPWFTQPDSDFLTGVDMPRDLSRYPGMPVAAAKGSQQQQHWPATGQQQQQTGRSNRNSIQYNVGAPRELIFQEADIAVPATISEDDDDDGLSTNGDPMMRLSRYASNHTLKSNSTSLQP